MLWRHALPNALGPTFQVIALNIAYLAAGVILVEYLFNYPGIGSPCVDAVARREHAGHPVPRHAHRRGSTSSPTCSPTSARSSSRRGCGRGCDDASPRSPERRRRPRRRPSRPRGLFRSALRLWRTRIGLMLVVVARRRSPFFGPLFAPHGETEFVGTPNTRDVEGLLFGTDYLGQDVWSRFLYGGRTILVLAVVATAIGAGARHRRSASSRPTTAAALDDVLMRIDGHHPRLPAAAARARGDHHVRAEVVADRAHRRPHRDAPHRPRHPGRGVRRGRARLHRRGRGAGRVASRILRASAARTSPGRCSSRPTCG